MQKIVFLDIDGPFIPDKCRYIDHIRTDFSKDTNHWCTFDPFAVKFFNELFLHNANLYAVMHTSWRKYYPENNCQWIIDHFKDQGCKFQWHKDRHTPIIKSATRWEEIATWLKDHPSVTNQDYVIVEDEKAPTTFKTRTARINEDHGLSTKDCKRIKELLHLHLPKYNYEGRA